jgi:hypothetical protein
VTLALVVPEVVQEIVVLHVVDPAGMMHGLAEAEIVPVAAVAAKGPLGPLSATRQE